MATVSIVPAILTDDVGKLKASMEKYKTFAGRVQVDISDGTLAGTRTVAESEVVIPAGLAVDMHMMVASPVGYVEKVLKLKPNMVIFHAEAEGDLLPIFAQLKQAGVKAGVAFLKQTYPGGYRAYIEAVDHVLIFAGELGVQGSTADLMQVEKARIVRAIRKDVEIGWDGGATLQNVRTIFQGGITVINVGKAIDNAADAEAEYKALVTEAEKVGVM